ncbi:MAG: thioredoxin family protein [Desulfotignum sp.]
MTPSEIAKITDWAASQTHIHTLFLSDTTHAEQTAFKAFASELTSTAPCIRITPSDRQHQIPTLFISDNIGFSALPLDRELTPFLEALAFLADPVPLPEDTHTLLKQISRPCHLTLFIATQCPHCPDMVRHLIPLAVHSKNIFINIIDGTLFPEIAQAHRVMSVPCLILETDFRWTGQVNTKEILTQMIEQDPSRLSATTFRQILEQGDADWISSRMIQADTLFKGFMDLLLHPEWSVRLGAMVVVENLAEQAPQLAARLSPVLIQAFADVSDISIQGDILYALGEVGDQKTREWIEKKMPVLTHPDLKDAAQDALSAIEDRV